MGFLTDHTDEMRRVLADEPLDETALLERAGLMPPPRDFIGALRLGAINGGPAVIAEVKRASPSAGAIKAADPAQQAQAYAAAGASAISVLTEPKHFGGSLADLGAVRRSVTVPVMRKDFIVHPAQVLQARAEGADAVLLIATCLSLDELLALESLVRDLGMTALVEAFGADDLRRALATPAEAIGVNARDLETLEVDEARALALVRTIPDERVAVFESGISSRAQVEAATAAGAGAVLVGTALMLADDPEAKLHELRGVGA